MSEVHKLSRVIGHPGPQPLDSLVSVPNGWKKIGSMLIGDKIMTPFNGISEIIGIFDFDPTQTYKITLNDQTKIYGTEDHKWPVYESARKYDEQGKRVRTKRFVIKKTSELIAGGKRGLHPDSFFPVKILYQKLTLDIHPYVLGALLGNGYFGDHCKSIQLTDKLGHIANAVKNYGYNVRQGYGMQWRVNINNSLFKKEMKECRAKTKYIPSMYLISSVDQRELLLAGLMDTDGRVGDKGKLSYSSCSLKLCESVISLVRSLGGKAQYSSCTDKRQENGYVYKVNLCTEFNPFKHQPWKVKSWKPQRIFRYIHSIEPDKIVPVRCIQISDPMHLYVTNDYTATHNTGKTSYVLGLVEAAAKKYDPERIGAVSYTNAAVEEMKDRLAKASESSHQSAKNIRTIHSHCFQLLNMKREQVADGAAKIRDFNEANPAFALPLDLRTTSIEDPGSLHGQDQETKEMNASLMMNLHNHRKMNYYRNIMAPMSEWPEDVQEFHRAWRSWMNLNRYFDFTHMLEEAFYSEVVPDIDILFVDEAQDTNVLQMRILEKWNEHVTSAVWVGDSNQAIMRFSGSVPENFMNIKATWSKVLEKSYRVPKKILDYAVSILRTYCEDREESPFEPRDGDEGKFMHGMTEPDLSFDGSHMILCRCNYMLSEWRDFLIKHGRPWHNPYRPDDLFMNPTKTQIWQAVKTYVKLKDGDTVSIQDILKMIENVQTKGNLVPGTKSKVKSMDDNLEYNLMEEVDFRTIGKLGFFTDELCTLKKPIDDVFSLKGKAGALVARLSKEEAIFLKKPTTILSTIHGSKGGEADNVWVDTRTSPKGYRMWQLSQANRNDEARVAYVAATRAKKRLGLMHGWKGSQAYMNRAFFV